MTCANCGAVIGPGPNIHGQPESCSEEECIRLVREMYRQMDEDAQEAARDDDFGRYR